METAEERLDTLQSIELAEGVEVHLRIAGPLLRGLAWALDLLIQSVLLTALAIAGMALGDMVSQGLIMLAVFFISWWYPVVFEAGRRGATPGKRACGLRVVQPSGSPVTFGQAVVRNFLRFVDAMPFFTWGFGLASCVATRRFQRLGDLAAGTVVIYDKVPVEPMVAAPPPIKPLRPPMALMADEARALVAFRERSGFWSEGRRRELASHTLGWVGGNGTDAVTRLMAMAHWLQEKR